MTDDEYDAYVRRVWPGLLRKAQWAGALDPDDAHWAVSQVLLELYARLPGIAAEEDADFFVRGRLKNRVIDAWRRHRPHEGHEQLCENLAPFETFHPSSVSPDKDPDEWVEFEVADKAALELLNSLSEADRKHLRLRSLDFTSSECATELGITPGTERVRWCRLTKRLRSNLEAAAANEKEATAW
ncbi:RNA polymerase sigma factor [Streptomyces tendae]|uniref:RNA polymerase sigma factor n=1 Tax=Streptomyces tendae TaxID=1932 RepID=UPI00371E3ABF